MTTYMTTPHPWRPLSRKSPTCQDCGEVKDHPLHKKREKKLAGAVELWIEGTDMLTARLSPGGKHIEIAPAIGEPVVIERLSTEKAQRLIGEDT